MTQPEFYLFGDQQLHDGLRLLARILGGLAEEAPRAVCTERLRQYCDCPPAAFKVAWASLMKSGLLRRDQKAHDHWVLAHDLSTITLEDLVHCLLSRRRSYRKSPAEAGRSERLSKDVDVFLSHAAIEINQQAFGYLRRMFLDRLECKAQVFFPCATAVRFEPFDAYNSAEQAAP